MEKPADDVFQIPEPLKRRLSLCAFAERLVEHAKLRSMSEGGRWAPSAFSAQPSSFVTAAKRGLKWIYLLVRLHVRGESTLGTSRARLTALDYEFLSP